MTPARHDVITDALAHIDHLGFEMGPGFATHAPMGAEALLTLGHPNEVVRWIDQYVQKIPHFPRPEPSARIDPRDESDWRGARGDPRRLSDWVVLFEEELDAADWREVLGRWWPRLLPGALAGLTHGLIRTAHAVRSLAADPRPSGRERRELASGLAYWAARYAPLPGQPAPHGSRSVPQAVAAIPHLHPSAVLGRVRAGAGDAEAGNGAPELGALQDAVDQLAPADDVDAALLRLTAEYARRLRLHAAPNPVPLVHTVTAPAAARLLLPYLPPAAHRPTFDWVWQVTAALTAVFGGQAPPRSDAERQPLSPEELSARAAEHGAAHAIKLTEACLREYRANPDPAYLLCAEDVVPRIAPDTAVDQLPRIPQPAT